MGFAALIDKKQTKGLGYPRAGGNAPIKTRRTNPLHPFVADLDLVFHGVAPDST